MLPIFLLAALPVLPLLISILFNAQIPIQLNQNQYSLPPSNFFKSMGEIGSIVRKNILNHLNEEPELEYQCLLDPQVLIDFFTYQRLCSLFKDDEDHCAAVHGPYLSSLNWRSKGLAIWQDSRRHLPTLEKLFYHTGIKRFYVVAKNVNPTAYKICYRVYEDLCTINVMVDIDKHVRGFERTKLPFNDGRFVPYSYPFLLKAVNELFFVFAKIYVTLHDYILKSLLPTLGLQGILNTKSFDIWIENAINLFIVGLFFYATTVIRFSIFLFWKYVVCSFLYVIVRRSAAFTYHCLVPVFCPITRVLSGLTNPITGPFFIFWEIIIQRLSRPLEIVDTKLNVDDSKVLVDDSNLNINDSSKGMDKADSAFLEHQAREEQVNLQPLISQSSLSEHELTLSEPQANTLAPGIETFNNLFKAGFHLFLEETDFATSDPELSIVSHPKHHSFENGSYILYLQQQNDLQSVACIVYSAIDFRTKEKCVAHLYPIQNDCHFICFENHPKELAPAVKTIDIIVTNAYLIQITENQDPAYNSLREFVKQPLDGPRPYIRLESFIWGMMYDVLPALEIALKNKCYYGELEIALLSRGLLLRSIRHSYNPSDNTKTLLDSFISHMKQALTSFQDLEERKFTNIFIKTLRYLTSYTCQYKATVVAWRVAKEIRDHVNAFIESHGRTFVDIEGVEVPSIDFLDQNLIIENLNESEQRFKEPRLGRFTIFEQSTKGCLCEK